MNEDFLIRIDGRMEQAGETDSVELMTRGSFVHRGGSFFITYKESETTGYAGCEGGRGRPEGVHAALRPCRQPAGH